MVPLITTCAIRTYLTNVRQLIKIIPAAFLLMILFYLFTVLFAPLLFQVSFWLSVRHVKGFFETK
jgi:hypothetical protein